MADLFHSILRWLVLALIFLSFVRLMIAISGKKITYGLFIAAFFFLIIHSRLRKEIMMAVYSWEGPLTAMIMILLVLFGIQFMIRKTK